MEEIKKTARMTIRVSEGSLAFALADKHSVSQIIFKPFTCRSGVSMAVNLREAFKSEELLRTPTDRAQVLVDAQVLLVPIEEYRDDAMEALYKHSFPKTDGSVIMSNVLPDLNAVALFSVNRDLKMVVEDHYNDVKFVCLMRPVWNYMHRRSFVGNRRKLYAHFHDNKLELFSFERNRFIFCNRFEVKHSKDAEYFILFVWKQLALDQQRDNLFLSGDIPEREALLDVLKQYIGMVSVVKASADFNRAPITMIKGITWDIISLYV
ncbi:MAG: DUF3822 family protein [Prevotella sp.]